jgi:hypothetical protein
MINDYKNWIKSKHELLHHLQHHNSIILSKVENVIKTLNFIAQLKEEEMNEDYSVIFDCGYSYIYQLVSDVELYLDKYFNNNMHQFLEYELLINYSFYLNDLKYALLENESYTETINEEFNYINNNIENILQTKRQFIERVLDDYDNRIIAVINTNEVILTTPEVYDRIYEELQIMEGHIDE